MKTREFGADGLVARANVGLRADEPLIEDQRVSVAADVRMIRYYQTLGILDRPLRYEGRSAVYGERHVAQLRAIKALQAGGMSLQLIQRRLAACTDVELAAMVSGAGAEGAGDAGVGVVPRRLIALEVARGIVLTVDPSARADAERFAARLAETMVRVLEERP